MKKSFYIEVEVEEINSKIEKYENEGWELKDILSAYMKPGHRKLGLFFQKPKK